MRTYQKISEIVGNGHPDLIADRIAGIVEKWALSSACEVLINSKIAVISGEVMFANKRAESSAKLEISNLLEHLEIIYEKEKPKRIIFDFNKQNEMLAERKNEMKAGDQEIVYYHELKDKDAHFILRSVKEWVDIKYPLLDYKILLNLENLTANISLSTPDPEHYDTTEKIKSFITKKLLSEVDEAHSKDLPTIVLKVSYCIYSGGSIWNDTGVTGRKIIAEKHGAGFSHGGGAIYGKDISKTAPSGFQLAKEYANSNGLSDVVLVYFPNDNLDNPNYLAEEK